MELEAQVCNLELAKRLNELGIKQESLFYWTCWGGVKPSDWWVGKSNNEITSGGFHEYLSAFTVAELGEMLPISVETWRTEAGFMCANKEGECMKCFHAANEADARAQMIIYLIQK